MLLRKTPYRMVKVVKKVDIDLPEGQSWYKVSYQKKRLPLTERILLAMRTLKAVLS